MKSIKILISLIFIAALAMQTFGIINVSAQNYVTGNYEGKFEYLITNDQVTITAINKSLNELTIPSKIEGYPVTIIGSGACKNGKLTKLSLPNTLEIIGEHAFEDNYINDINIPSSVKYILDYAFYHGYHYGSPESFTFREGLEYIGKSAFGELFWDVNTITIPSTVWYIGEMAFFDSKLNSIYIMSMNACLDSNAINRSTTIYGYDNSIVASTAVDNSWKYQSLGKFTGVQKAWSNVYGYDNSKLVSGRKVFDGHLYWFTSYGRAYTGLVPMTNGDIYYFSKKEKNMGQALTGWVKIGNKKYYFLSSGDNKYKAAKGWMKIKGEKYYFYSDGTMATGKVTIKGKKYEFDKNGKLIN